MGRKWAIFLWVVVFLIGASIQMIADYDVLLAGRFIGGLGVGATSVLTPQFLAENSPKSIRGALTASYNLMIVTSLMIAFWINYAVSKWNYEGVEHDNKQWRTAMGIQLIPAALMAAMIPFLYESPRYLVNHGKNSAGLDNLCRLRNLDAEHPYLQTEYQEMVAQTQYEQECYQGHSYWVIIKEIFTNKSNFQRFFLAIMLFLFHKFTGTDSLNVRNLAFSPPQMIY
jgi:MFS family permease